MLKFSKHCNQIGPTSNILFLFSTPATDNFLFFLISFKNQHYFTTYQISILTLYHKWQISEFALMEINLSSARRLNFTAKKTGIVIKICCSILLFVHKMLHNHQFLMRCINYLNAFYTHNCTHHLNYFCYLLWWDHFFVHFVIFDLPASNNC